MKTVALFRRRPGLSRAAFRDYYETRHAPLAVQHVRFRKYVRNHLVAPAEGDFDVLSEFWLADPKMAATLDASPAGATLRADAAEFMGKESYRATVSEELVAGQPRAVEDGVTRKYILLMARPPSVAQAEFLDLVRNWGTMLFAGRVLSRVTMDVVTTMAGSAFPADAVISLWPNERFSDSTLGGGTGLLAIDSCETPPEALAAAFR
jgi:uncharacterized protein (TIGR02118 family)